MSVQTIKDKIRERYGAIAGEHVNDVAAIELVESRPAASCCGSSEGSLYQAADGVSCCGPSDAATLAEALYGQAVGDLPDSVTGVSLGCGNPTAIRGLSPGETVLDLGSGGGIDCFLAAKAVGPGGYVIGVDMTDNMLALANQNKAKMSVTNVEFRKGEIENLPVQSNSVDVIISNCVINLSPDKDAVFAEAFRVLKPGGRLTVSDVVTQGELPEPLRSNVNAWTGCISGALDINDYLDKLLEAGFVEVSVDSKVSYGLENLDEMDDDTRRAILDGLDETAIPQEVRVFSANIVAYKR